MGQGNGKRVCKNNIEEIGCFANDNVSIGHNQRILKIGKGGPGINVGIYRVCRNKSLGGVG